MKRSGVLLLLCSFFLSGLGILMLASIADVQGASLFHDKNHFLLNQIMYLAVAVLGCGAAAFLSPGFWFRKPVLITLGVFIVVALIAVHIPGLGHATKGASRWIRLFGVQVQPSEFVKIFSLLLLSSWVGATSCRNRQFVPGVLYPVLGLGLVLLGLLAQHDLGSTVMLAASAGVVLFLSGARIKYLLILLLIGLIGVSAYVARDPERLSRVTAVLHIRAEESPAPSTEQDDDTYQLRMALSAIGSGGIFGKGLGNSIYKQRYLPENHTDFILAMIGEELGLIATSVCWLVYFCMMFLGCNICLNAPDKRLQLFAAGLSIYLCASAAVNIGVVTGLFPTKGLALPFLSYGGSNLIASYLTVGLLFSIALRSKPKPAAPEQSCTLPATDLWST